MNCDAIQWRRGWEELCRHALANTRRCFEVLRVDPRSRSSHDRQHRLRGDLATHRHNGRDLEQWEFEVTSGGRVRYAIDDVARTVQAPGKIVGGCSCASGEGQRPRYGARSAWPSGLGDNLCLYTWWARKRATHLGKRMQEEDSAESPARHPEMLTWFEEFAMRRRNRGIGGTAVGRWGCPV
ncbi:hypothetical protein ACIBO5_35060 [Nonomuraea angiospora]|uniref:hypothetical protein n=1 Tax=Nonomuraea angiospora TaxID=46172 RepID=UPI0037B6A15F